MNTLITFRDTWGLWAALFGCAAFGLWIERTPWAGRLPGAAFTLVLAFLLSNFGIIPAAAPVYKTVWFYLVPLAIPLLLFNANVQRIPRDSQFILMAFVIGAVGTVVGAVVAFYLVPLGKSAWQMAAVFSAAFIGGPMNYTATAHAVGLRVPNLFAGGLATIDLIMMVYFLFMFALPILWNMRWSSNESASDHGGGASINLLSMALALALSAAICVAGFFIEARFGWKGTAILIIAAIAVGLAAALPRKMATLQGANELGVLLMLVFFATIGASANISVVFKNRPILLMFAAVILVVHLAVLLAAGKYLKISLSQLIIASNAGVGDSTTAAAMAAVRRWYQYVPAAILCGTLGYASATFIGVRVGKFLH